MKPLKLVISTLICALLVFVDQFTKYLIVRDVEMYKELPLIGNSFVITHIHNSGSAWGILSNKTVFLVIVSIIVLLIIFYVYSNIYDNKRYLPIRVIITLLTAGAIGNMIDRVRLGYVVDFLYFKAIDFPVFNFADICVTISIFVMIFLVIFKYNGNDFDVILGDKYIDEQGEYIEKESRFKKK